MTFRAANDPVKRIEILTEERQELERYAREMDGLGYDSLAKWIRRRAAGKKAAITRLGRQL